MAYEPNNASETTMLPKDTVMDGTIKTIADGKVKDFVHDTTKWTGDTEQQAINITVEVEGGLTFTQIFTYNEKDGKTQYSPTSNIGKYKKKYDKLPEAGDKIKVSSNSDGFGKIKLD